MSLADWLNILWAASAVTALGALALRERRHRSRLRDRCRRGFAVFLAAVALFPCISASDDLVRFGIMPAALSVQGPAIHTAAQDQSDGRHAIHLARLLEALESFQIAMAIAALVAICFFAWVRFRAEYATGRTALAPTSRGPPQLAFLGL